MLNGKRYSVRKWWIGKKLRSRMKRFSCKESKYLFCPRKLSLERPMIDDLPNGRIVVLDHNLTDGWNRSLVKPMGLDELLPDGWSAVAGSLDHDDLANGRMMKQHFQEDGKGNALNLGHVDDMVRNCTEEPMIMDGLLR